MDRSEPTLVPEWLKGTSGGGAGIAASHHHFSGSHSGSDRPFHSSSRRGLGNNSGGSERANCDRDPFSQSRAYASFRRSYSVRSSDLEHEKDWEWDREKSFGAGGNDWSISRTGRVEGELTLRRSRSVISNRSAENEAKKSANGLQNITMAPPIRGGLVSNIQKAAFERNFPSLGAEDRPGTIQSNLANVAVLNSSASSIWPGQRSTGRSDIGRTSSPGLTVSTPSTSVTAVTGISAVGTDGWKSALAEAPVLNGILQNGLSSSGQHSGPGNSVVSKGHGLPSASGLNMAEALVQNTARPRTPQLTVEVQRLEELALKQSRQLIPMTPSMPKTMGLSPSEKSKAKSLRSIDTSASTVKNTQLVGSSHLINSPKLGQGGKLLVLKPGREIGSNVSVKPDGASPVKGGSTGSTFGASPTGSVDLGGNMVGLRKHKLPADHKAMTSASMPASSAVDGGSAARLEEKKPVSQAQNRNDFFNALRRKASESQSCTGNQDKASSSMGNKADEESGKVPLTFEDTSEVKDKGSTEHVVERPDIAASLVQITAIEKDKANSNGFVSGQIETSVRDTSENGTSPSANKISVKVGSEEEEAAFLRSLGWEENAAGEEALTEEEIRSFYQELQHMRSMPKTIPRGSRRLWNLNIEMHIGNNVESMPSGIGSSESA